MTQVYSPARKRNLQASLTVLLLVSIVLAFSYATFLFDFSHISNVILYLILVFIEVYIMIQTIGTWWTILYTDNNPRDHVYAEQRKIILQHNSVPGGVAVFITTYGEDPAIIKKTAIAARDMSVEHETYILDDGRSPIVEELAKELEINYITRSTNEGKKAGNINNALTKVDASFVAIFDADHKPEPNFLLETLPFFADEHVAFVQTPQHLTNEDNVISAGSSDAQKVFYELVCSGKNKFNSMFWVGTNAIFRKHALDVVGGVVAHSSEDIMTSYKIHQAGWKSVYIPDILAKGLAPDEIGAYFKQQLRWAGGGFTIFFRQNPIFSKLTIDQKIQYFLTSTFYFSGFVILFMVLLPIIFLLFGVKAVDAAWTEWLRYYVPYFFFQFIMILILTGRLSWQAYILSINSFPSYIGAFLRVILNRDIKWNVTGARQGKESNLTYVWPHFLLLFVCVASLPIGLLSYQFDVGTTIWYLFWTCLNIVSITSFLVLTRTLPFSNLFFKKPLQAK